MDEVKVGFIGCGGNARGHMTRVHELEGARVAAVCDTVEELAGKAAEQFESTPYTDLNRMLDTADLDAVVISIPVFAHGAPEKAAIERGLPFLVEKPVARHLETAREIEALVEQAGIITAVGYQLRYSQTVSKAREILSGRTVNLAMGTYWCGTGRAAAGKWTTDHEQSGGQLLEQATHTVDMMRYLVGEIEEVHAYGTHRILTNITSDDATAVTWRYANGAIGSLTTNWALDNTDWRYANQVYIGGDLFQLHWTHSKLTAKLGAEPVEEIPGEAGSLDAVFCDAVRRRDGSGILSPYADGVRSMAVSLAALKSIATGEAVRVAELG